MARAPRTQGSRNVGAQGLARRDSPQPLAAAWPSVGGGSATALCPADLSAGNRGSTDLGLAGTVWDRREVSSVTGAQVGVGEARSPHLPSPVPRPAPGQLVVAWKLPHAERRVTLPEPVRGVGQGRAGRVSSLGDAAWGKPESRPSNAPWKEGGWTQSEGTYPRRARIPNSKTRGS